MPAPSIPSTLSGLRLPSWFTPAIATDWVVSVVLLVIDKELNLKAPFQQPIKPFLGDPTLQYAHVSNETVPGVVNTWLTFMLPLALVLLIGAARRKLKEVHHGALAIWSGYQLVNVATDFVKLRVGRFRPDFFARCQYDAVLGACTGIPSVINEGRKSFPSGHSSSSWFGCVFLMLFLAGKNRCFAFDATFQHSGILWSRFLRLSIALSPLFLSTYVAVSRWEDHWHHPTDIATGALLGTLIAVIIYHIWFPSPFSSANFETMGYPRKTHREIEDDARELEEEENEPLLSEEQV